MVVHGRGRHDADDPVVGDHVPDSQEEWQPVLIESDDRDHDEEVKVQLDVAARQMDEDPGGTEQPEAGDG